MIAAIFNKSKPINLVLASLLLVFGFFVVQLQTTEQLNWQAVLLKTGLVFIAVFSILIVDFIVKKNALSEQNSFIVYFFSLFFFCFWYATESSYLLLSNFFVLLALRKIISLKSQINNTKKIFDAAFWICIAALFHFWAILFLIILYLGILLYCSEFYKNWLVPLVSIFVVLVCITAYEMVVNNQLYQFSNTTIVKGFESMNSTIEIVMITFFSILLLVSLVFLSSSVKLKLQKNKLSYVVLLFALLIGIIIVFISPNKSVAMFVYGYFPLAASFTVFFEKITKPWLQSSILYGMLLASIVLCFFSV